MGYVQNEQSALSPGHIKSFGLLLADRTPGPFTLDVRSLRAVNLAKELAKMDARPPS